MSDKMKTKIEAKKEALAYVGDLWETCDENTISVRKTLDTVIVIHNGSTVREIKFTPLIKDAPYYVWDGDTRPEKPCMLYYTGEGMEFYSCDDDRYMEFEWDHCEKMKVG